MSKPCLIINGHDYTPYLEEEGLQPEDNDLDADGSGRNILNGLMYRTRIATKEKWAVKFNRLNETIMSQLLTDLPAGGDYVKATLLDAKSNRKLTKEYYYSSVKKGTQLYRSGRTVYDGVNFNLTER
jgi:hypothetical protein